MPPLGRKPTPTALKLVQGNPGKRPLNAREPKPRQSIPTPPSCLGETGKREWNRVARELARLGLLTGLDRAVLAGYCGAYQTWYQASEQLKEEGLTSATTNGNVIQNPVLGIRNKAAQAMVAMGAELGMTPSSRSRLAASPVDEDDPAEKYFGGK